jgi:hypothetical protein
MEVMGIWGIKGFWRKEFLILSKKGRNYFCGKDYKLEIISLYMVEKSSGMAVASLVLGLCSLFLFWTLVVPILAIVFGFVGLSNIKHDKNLVGRKMAIWGIVLGFFWFVLFLILVIVGVGWVVLRNITMGA